MTPTQYAAARTDLADAVAALKRLDAYDPELATLSAPVFMRHTERLAGHVALLLAEDPDPFAGLTGPEAVGADPTRSTPTQGPTP